MNNEHIENGPLATDGQLAQKIFTSHLRFIEPGIKAYHFQGQ